MARLSKRDAAMYRMYNSIYKKQKKALKKPCPDCGCKLNEFDLVRLKCTKCKKIWYVDKLLVRNKRPVI